MKVLRTGIAGTQKIKIIPRVYTTTLTIKLRDNSTNEVTEFVLVPSFPPADPPAVQKVGNYLEIIALFTLVENRFYDLTIYNGIQNLTDLDIIYKDKIFCTDQFINQNTNNQYSINNGEYISEEAGNNDYIII